MTVNVAATMTPSVRRAGLRESRREVEPPELVDIFAPKACRRL
jgi:hypothetical protein